jgi:hypothetical protein
MKSKSHLGVRGLFAAAALFGLVGTASAAELVLKTAVAKPTTTAIDGRIWSCEADKCVAAGQGDPQPLKRECRRVVAELGPVKTYKSENGALDETAAAACNAK